MKYLFTFHPYKRRFIHPVQTNHGVWEIREGIIVSLKQEDGQVGQGEIAPIPWFGSETLEQALEFCSSLPKQIDSELILSIPDTLPACQFGFETALTETPEPPSLQFSALLPAGKSAIDASIPLWQSGYRTFKWKIAVNPIDEELAIFDLLVQKIVQNLANGAIRLDANGGLSLDEAKLWLETCDKLMANGVNIEFIEQPLPRSQFEQMLELSASYNTKLALDESVATLQNLETCYSKGWRQIFVIKPLIIGSPSKLRQFCQQNQIDTVFSSVFETDVGRTAALQLASELSHHNRAVGFGINHWFQ
ncbi:o-succinylbenzoate synthase [Dulcicalothrix desertica PCC 7102]|uniref:o-succinylbenzoate synthase n=1 Tax=Dulcicalothrix desertica PCC 7102 TaxID=232991 RepID=A0A433UHJ3_9CYAN|nr:o-succinylbenzoate synthase [Dulcicalothrix desertica]RUS93274.1 o-succinylbenzoate synthase [Dulcicalothrix desertica PCC 7102]TWH40386.1 O-succinylbenzoate synthase [Dulcicalothrix desertica PCC 7102]